MTAPDEATLLAFERLCRSCKHLLPHALFRSIYCGDGESFETIEEDLESGPTCQAGLRPLTRDGHDCPYFMRGAE